MYALFHVSLILGAIHTETEMSFILELHIYVSLYLFTWYQNKFSFLYKLFREEFIPVFIPN